MFFVRIRPMKIKEQLIAGGFGEEVLAVRKVFDFIKFKFHKIENSLDVGLHTMSAWEDGAVRLTVERFNGEGISRRMFGIPRADVLGTIVSLSRRIFREGIKFFQEVIDVDGKEMSMS